MNYLGYKIDLVQQDPGWTSVWYHPVYVIQLGFFPTPNAAWDAAIELIQRDTAVRSLLNELEEWDGKNLIGEDEHSLLEESLVNFVVTI